MSDAKHFFSKDYNYSEKDLGKSIQSWLSYQIALNRNYSLAESSINFPFGEYLAQYVAELELEKQIEYFESRWYDAFFKIRDNDISYYFEFKYTKEGSTRNQPGKQRVFNDLMRLNAFDDHMSRKFFIMAGKSEDFICDFEQLTLGETLSGKKLVPTNQQKSVKYSSVYNKMFSFDLKNPDIIIDLNDDKIGVLLQGFDSEYKKNYINQSFIPYSAFLLGASNIKTSLKFISRNGFSAKVGIWEVTRSFYP